MCLLLSGFIGFHLVERLLPEGWQVVGLDSIAISVTEHGIAILYGVWVMGQTGYVAHAVVRGRPNGYGITINANGRAGVI